MALTRTFIGQDVDNSGTSSASTLVVGPFTPTNGSLLVALVAALDYSSAADGTAFTMSGGGLTWTLQKHTRNPSDSSRNLQIWTAPVGVGASMSVTFLANTPAVEEASLHVVQYTGYDTSDPVDATDNDVTPTAAGDRVLAHALGAIPASSEIIAIAENYDPNSAFTPEAAATLVSTDFPSNAYSAAVMAKGGSTSGNIQWDIVNSNFGTSGIAIEIVASSGDMTGAADLTMSFNGVSSAQKDAVGAAAFAMSFGGIGVTLKDGAGSLSIITVFDAISLLSADGAGSFSIQTTFTGIGAIEDAAVGSYGMAFGLTGRATAVIDTVGALGMQFGFLGETPASEGVGNIELTFAFTAVASPLGGRNWIPEVAAGDGWVPEASL